MHAYYGEADIALQATILAQAISDAPAFVDGNKRTALIALDAFLEANGLLLASTQQERAEWILELSTTSSAVDRIAARVRDSLQLLD